MSFRSNAAAVERLEAVVPMPGKHASDTAQQLDRLDFKTVLQELTARMFDSAPVYVLRESGPDHAKTFAASVLVGGRVLGEGTGRSKKVAEQMAASAAHGLLTAER